MIKIQYRFHLLLNTKYKHLINSTLILVLFFMYDSENLSYCMTEELSDTDLATMYEQEKSRADRLENELEVYRLALANEVNLNSTTSREDIPRIIQLAVEKENILQEKQQLEETLTKTSIECNQAKFDLLMCEHEYDCVRETNRKLEEEKAKLKNDLQKTEEALNAVVNSIINTESK